MKRQKKQRIGIATIILVCGSTTACIDQQATASSSGDVAVDTGNPQSSAMEQTMDSDRQVSIAKQHLADRLSISVDEINVDTARAVQWRSGAAGCPKPGMSYTMAIVPGIQILLSAKGNIYRYHAVRDQAPKYCPADRAEAPAYGQGEEVM